MSAPLFLLITTTLLALLLSLLRRHPTLTAFLGVLGSTLLGAFALYAWLDKPFVLFGVDVRLDGTFIFLGRSLVLDATNRAQVGFLYLSGAFLIGGTWIHPENRRLSWLGLPLLAVVAGSLMIRPFLFAALMLELAAMGAVLILTTPSRPSTLGASRLLTLYTLAMMAILISGWMIERLGVTTETSNMARGATLLLVLGFAVIMGVPPFHAWLPAAARRSRIYALVFVSIVLQNAGLFFLLRLMDTYAWIRGDPGLFVGMRIASAAMVVFGCLMATVQTRLSTAMAYALISDFGVSLLAVGLGRPEGYQLALGLSGARVVSLTVFALGIEGLQAHCPGDRGEQLAGSAGVLPWPTVAVIAGLLSLAGFPLTAGFPARWGLLVHLPPNEFGGVAVVIGTAVLSFVAFRWLGFMLAPATPSRVRGSSPAERVMLVLGTMMTVALGAFPQLLYPWLLRALAGLSNLVP